MFHEKKENITDMENKKIFLYLDGVRSIMAPAGYQLVTVRSYSAFTNYIEIEGLPDLISFEHDLTDEHREDAGGDATLMAPWNKLEIDYENYQERTGMDAARWLTEYCMENSLPIPMCRIHSMNPTGAENILTYLNNYGRIHEELPYSCCRLKLYNEPLRIENEANKIF